METTVKIGSFVKFGYDGEVRQVRVETVNLTPKKGAPCFGGWDFTADAPVGGYRSFHIDKIENLVVCGQE